MKYPVKLEKDGEGWFASFPDIPEALTSGTSIDHALQMAKDALITAMDFYCEDGRAVPLPSAIEVDAHRVDLHEAIAAADRGEFASDEEVKRFFAKYGA